MSKFKNFMEKVFNFFINLKNKTEKGYKWLGSDGIINMETSVLLMIVFTLFFPILWSAFLTFIIVLGKCAFDKTKNRKNEKHDLICAIVGIIIGIILATVNSFVKPF